MFERKEHFIGGNWHAASGAFDGDLLDVISPSTEEIVERVPAVGPTEIDLAVASAQSAFRDGPWAPARPRDTAERFIASGLGGAKVVLGGGRPAPQPKGRYVEPTIITEVDNRMEIAREEIFSRALSVIFYCDKAEAIAIANDSTYGLGGGPLGGRKQSGGVRARGRRAGEFFATEAGGTARRLRAEE